MHKSTVAWALLVVAWGVACSAGLLAMARYEFKPGESGHAPPQWPTQSEVPISSDRYTLVLAAHAGCPCTRASLDELDRLMARHQDRIAAHVLYYQPPGSEFESALSLRRSAEKIPGVRVWPDPQAHQAALFDACTSGQVVVYSPQGALVFSGGITGSRGHSGENDGVQAIERIVSTPGQSGPAVHTAVFGCGIRHASGISQPDCCAARGEQKQK